MSDVDSSARGRGLVLITGTTAALLVAVMVVALTPPRSSAPEAISATTLPAVDVRDANTPRSSPDAGDRVQGIVRLDRSSVSPGHLFTLSGSPNAISALPVDADATADDLDLASELPGPDERVIILTATYTYDVRWRQLARIANVPADAVVITRTGELIATFVDGEIVIVVP